MAAVVRASAWLDELAMLVRKLDDRLRCWCLGVGGFASVDKFTGGLMVGATASRSGMAGSAAEGTLWPNTKAFQAASGSCIGLDFLTAALAFGAGAWHSVFKAFKLLGVCEICSCLVAATCGAFVWQSVSSALKLAGVGGTAVMSGLSVVITATGALSTCGMVNRDGNGG